MLAQLEPLIDAFRADANFREFVLERTNVTDPVEIVFYSADCVGVITLDDGPKSRYCRFEAYFPLKSLRDPWLKLDRDLALRAACHPSSYQLYSLCRRLWPDEFEESRSDPAVVF